MEELDFGVDIEEAGFGADYAAEQLRRSRHPLRRVIRRFYLDNILRDVRGPTIDLGCGAGQLLARLPHGSIGLELNKHLIAALQAEGLDARHYDPGSDDYAFTAMKRGFYRTMVLSHVLEHFDDVPTVMRKICSGCRTLDVERIVIVVPGIKGYRTDRTHRTFVTKSFIAAHELTECEGYRLSRTSCFPGNMESLGNKITYHETKLLYVR